jgi:hypothetical protein
MVGFWDCMSDRMSQDLALTGAQSMSGSPGVLLFLSSTGSSLFKRATFSNGFGQRFGSVRQSLNDLLNNLSKYSRPLA